MILSLTVAAFFDSIGYVMGDSHPEGALCDFQACWLTYFDWSALAWVCLITGKSFLASVLIMKSMPAFYQVVPSDGVGGAAGHGLFATAKGLLWTRRSLVSSAKRRRQDRAGGGGSEEDSVKGDERGRRMKSRGQRFVTEVQNFRATHAIVKKATPPPPLVSSLQQSTHPPPRLSIITGTCAGVIGRCLFRRADGTCLCSASSS
ncbi:hypothetical protein FQN60_001139 [Etheostoma spectabile]|uniref:Uncharacterized protein n=1 Tax=Etheostoma spectabile TaxID=54343 RepID=A0A5J5D5W3_9PERO|nr:hypothetical protein FQN60_001139 [Etheostoma spectabile]